MHFIFSSKEDILGWFAWSKWKTQGNKSIAGNIVFFALIRLFFSLPWAACCNSKTLNNSNLNTFEIHIITFNLQILLKNNYN